MATYAAAVNIFFSTGLVLPTLYQKVKQRLLNFTALVSYDLQYVNMWCRGYIIFQHWSRITYTISTSAAAVTTFFSTGLVLPKICQYVLLQLIHFSTLVSYYLHYINICCSGHVFYSTGLLLPSICQLVKQRLLHFQHWSRISYTLTTGSAAFISFFSTGLIIPTLGQKYAAAVTSFYIISLLYPTLCQHVLLRLIHFSALVSYYLH
jgi:hypothetical protein